jgi:OCT family organic cation transporter-like MFS transporter 4/5
MVNHLKQPGTFDYFRILPESSRWLASKGRTDDAIKILENVARVNGKGKTDTMELRIILEGCRERNASSVTHFNLWKSVTAPVTNFWSLIKTPNLRYRSLALWTLYFSVTVLFYGLSFLSVRLSSDPYVLFFLRLVHDFI